jgi:hypothetical protein
LYFVPRQITGKGKAGNCGLDSFTGLKCVSFHDYGAQTGT